jgi:hypothetical protein
MSIETTTGIERAGSRSAAEPPARATRPGLVALVAVAVATLGGGLLQVALPCGRCAMPFIGAAFAVLYTVVATALPARLRRALAAQESFATVLGVAAAVCALGTLVVQGQAETFYRRAYGPILGEAILRLGLDDAFHSLWVAALAGVFCGAVVLSGAQRWPPSRRTVGFHLAHLGLLVSLAGGATSAALAIRGRVELRAGETTDRVSVPIAHRSHAGAAASETVALGFALRLDRFDVERYGSELRIGYYERRGDEWRLRASFEPAEGASHRLPGGASFAVRAVGRAAPPVVVVRLANDAEDVPLLVGGGGHLTPGGSGALVLEPRPAEVKTFRSHVSVSGPAGERTGVVAVNAPFRAGGWTLYQASYDPDDPRYSALEAVRDPGAGWVFAGFALLSAGVAHALFTGARAGRSRSAHAATGTEDIPC